MCDIFLIKNPGHLRCEYILRISLCVLAVHLLTTPETMGYPDYNTDPVPPDYSGMESTAPQIAGRIQSGWNIGNTLEAIGGETAWGNPMISTGLIQLVKQNGFDAVRIPCSFDQYANGGTAEIDADWLDRVRQVVQYCVDEDIYVVLNIHWDGGWLENNVTTSAQAGVNDKQRAYWEQIATHLRDFDEHLIFASANEPNVENATQMAVLMSYHQTFVDAVRSTGGRNAYRTLVVQGPYTDIEKTYNLMTSLPVDTVPNRMMVEVHYYTPWQFCGLTEDAGWGQMFYYWGEDYHSTTDPDRNPDWWCEEDYLDYWFGRIKTRFVDNGIPVVLGEYSATRRSNLTGAALALHMASRAHFHDYVTEQANAHGFLPFYWDNGHTGLYGSGIFSRWSNTVFEQDSVDACTLMDTAQYWTAHGDAYADPPVAPPGLSAVGGDGEVVLSWSETTGATGYNLYRNSDGSESYAAIATNLTATNHTDTTVANGTTYYYVVTALNAGGESSNSLPASATPQALMAGPASNPMPADGAGDVSLSMALGWSAGTNADAHRVFFGFDSNAVAGATTNSPEFKGEQAGTVYDPGPLAASGRFYWRIDEMSGNMETVGPVWTFATALATTGNGVDGSVSGDGSAFEVSFPASPGQSYRVERTDHLEPASWQWVTNNVPGAGGTIYVTDPMVTSQRFYRVILLDP